MAVEKAKNIPPFVRFCAASVPMVFDNSLSYYECLCALTKKLQEIVDVINVNAEQLQGLLDSFEELKAYVDNYFDNLDVQAEINAKLDEMAEGGQLATIIAQFLAAAPVFAYDTISDMAAATNLNNGCIARVLGNTDAADGDGAYYTIRTIEASDEPDGFDLVAVGNTLVATRVINYAETKTQGTVLGLTWHFDGSAQTTTYLAYSNDAVNWKQVKLATTLGRDPSLVYDKKRKCFYVTVTPPANQSQTFTIYKTKDFVTYTSKTLQIGSYYGEDIMAPDLYMDEDNDQLIVHFSYKVDGTSTDVDSQTINNYWQYRTILGNLDDFSNITVAEQPAELTLSGASSDCIIDGNIIKVNGIYYMNCKDDVQKVIQVYSSVDGINYALVCANILNNSSYDDNSIYIEGGCWFKFNGEYYIVADAYAQYHNIIVGKTSDFIHFNFAPTNMYQLRHPGVITVDDNNLKAKLAELPNFGYSTNKELTAYSKSVVPARHINRNFNGQLTAIPGMIYTVFGNCTITDIKNPFNCDSVKFMFATNPGEKINVTKINGTTVNKVFVNSTSNNEKCFEISLCADVNAYPAVDFENVQEFTTDDLRSYFVPAENITISDGSAYRQGNMVSLSITITTSTTLDGYKTIFTRASGASLALTSMNKVIFDNENRGGLSGVAMFGTTGAIVGTFNNLPAGSYTIYASYAAK